MPNIRHVLTSPQADATGTVTIWNGATTSAVAASLLVRPSDWNAGHVGGLDLAASNMTYSSGTVVLSGGANVTVGTNGQTITIAGVAAQTVQTQNMVAFSASDALFSSGTVVLSGAGGGVTVNTAAGSVRVSVAAPVAQTVQTQNLHNLSLSGNTAGAMAQVSSGTLTLAGGNNITLSQNGNAVTISGAAAGGAQTAISGLANSQTTYTSGTVSLSELGAITIRSTTGNQFQFSVAAQSVQTFLGALQNSETTYTSGTVNLSVVGGQLTIRSTTGQAFQFSGPAAQTGISGVANSQTTYTSGTISWSELGAVTVRSTTGNQFQISVNSQTVQTQNLAVLYDGANSISSGTARFTNANGVSFTFNGQTISGSVAAGATATGNLGAIAMNAATTYTSGTVVLSAGANVGLGSNAQTVTISAAAFSAGISNLGNTAGSTGVTGSRLVFVGSGAISLSGSTDANGGTISINPPGDKSFYHWNREAMLASSTSAPINTSVSIVRMILPNDMSFTRVDIPVSMSLNTAATTATNAIALSAVGVIYSRNVSTLNAIVGQSSTTTYSYASNTGVFSSISGPRLLSFNLATRLSAGEYYLGFQISSNTSSVGASTTNLGGTIGMIFGGSNTVAPWRLVSADPTVSTINDMDPMQGMNSVSISNTSQTHQMSQITQSGTALARAGLMVLLRNV